MHCCYEIIESIYLTPFKVKHNDSETSLFFSILISFEPQINISSDLLLSLLLIGINIFGLNG